MDLVSEVQNQVNWVEVDLLDAWTIHEMLQGIEGVIHAGAMVSFNQRDQQTMMKVNVEGTSNIVNGCLENNIKKLVHISSIAVFSRTQKEQHINEQTPWNYGAKNTPYAISKYKAEMEVWRGAGEGLSVAIINPSLVLGSGFWEDTSVSIFKTIFKNLPFYPTGVNGFVDVRDVAKAAVTLLGNDIINRRYIISAENLSFQKVMTLMAEAMGKKAPTFPMTAFIKELALIYTWLTNRFARDSQVVTRTALRNASGLSYFDGTAAEKDLQLDYIPIEQTIAETSEQLLEAAPKNFAPRFLPLVKPASTEIGNR
jgi:nucleoside-diphosphate-sugar epimerase